MTPLEEINGKSIGKLEEGLSRVTTTVNKMQQDQIEMISAQSALANELRTVSTSFKEWTAEIKNVSYRLIQLEADREHAVKDKVSERESIRANKSNFVAWVAIFVSGFAVAIQLLQLLK